jgi:hypothetical protein
LIHGTAILDQAPCLQFTLPTFYHPPTRVVTDLKSWKVMACTPQLDSILTSNSVKVEFRTWLLTAGVSSVNDFVWAARSDKAFVDPELIDGCQLQLNLMEKVSIRKAWWVAKTSLDKEETAAKLVVSAVPDSTPISAEDAKNLHDAFFHKHAFKLGTKRLLADDLQGRLLRELSCSPKRLKLMLPESLRGAGSLSPSVGASFSLVGGQFTQGELVAPEDVGNTIELYLRLRALCNTLSLVTITSPTWLPFMAGEAFCDQLLEWMNAKYDGRRLPFAFYLQAYVSTFSFFTDAVRTNDTPLSDLMTNVSSFRSFWVNYSPPSSVPSMAPPHGPPPVRSGHSGQPDPAPAVSRELQKMREIHQKLHARVDKVSGHRDNDPNGRPPLPRRNSGGGGSSSGGGGEHRPDANSFQQRGFRKGKPAGGSGGGGGSKRKGGGGGGGGSKRRR